MPEERSRTRLVTAAIIAVSATAFAAYAASFLYFFVDDEAIPLVYARNLLRGRGLIYNLSEGRVEGYSDFLHVVWSAVLLSIARAAELSNLAPLNIGKGISFICGIAIVVLTGLALRHLRTTGAGLIGGLAFLALAGPLAMWSCSSLEEVAFALIVGTLGYVLLTSDSPVHAALAIVLGGIALLERIDGFVYVGALLAASLVIARAERRWWLARHIIAPVIVIAVVYHAARFLYFGTLFSAPIAAKVLYKVDTPAHVVVKAPDRSYLSGFVHLYGLAFIPAVAAAMVFAWRSRVGRGATIVLILLGAYVSTVGDWMFGWRMVVPLLPFLAVVIAMAISKAPSRLGWVAAVVVLVWSAAGARTFAREYEDTQHKPIWWTAPHLGREVWLAPYGDLIETARRAVVRGDTIAYNQAGLLPFILDVDNIDDLGIVSKFEADLPTTDVYYTEVGRYTPLTDTPVITAAHAYLLYRHTRMIISRTDLLTRANGGHIPSMLLDGYYRLVAVDASGANALYERTDKRADAYRRDPTLFRQNLAHFSRVRRVDWDGRTLDDSEVGPALPFLRWQTGKVHVHGSTRIAVRFADHDEDVYALYAAGLWTDGGAVGLTLTLYNEQGRPVARVAAQPDASPAPELQRFDHAVRARTIGIEAFAADGDADLFIKDLEVSGQSAVLKAYVNRMLKFPVP